MYDDSHSLRNAMSQQDSVCLRRKQDTKWSRAWQESERERMRERGRGREREMGNGGLFYIFRGKRKLESE